MCTDYLYPFLSSLALHNAFRPSGIFNGKSRAVLAHILPLHTVRSRSASTTNIQTSSFWEGLPWHLICSASPLFMFHGGRILVQQPFHNGIYALVCPLQEREHREY